MDRLTYIKQTFLGEYKFNDKSKGSLKVDLSKNKNAMSIIFQKVRQENNRFVVILETVEMKEKGGQENGGKENTNTKKGK